MGDTSPPPSSLPPPPPGGHGYWLVGSDGGVFAFGGAAFSGSMGGTPLGAPVVSMVGSANGPGYLLVARDGGIFAFGGAQFYGSMGGQLLSAPVVGAATATGGDGDWGRTRRIYSFGDAPYEGRTVSTALTTGGGPGATGAANSNLQPAGGLPGPWNLVFDSEFTGSTLDTGQ